MKKRTEKNNGSAIRRLHLFFLVTDFERLDNYKPEAQASEYCGLFTRLRFGLVFVWSIVAVSPSNVLNAGLFSWASLVSMDVNPE